jgi:hypothetical protein
VVTRSHLATGRAASLVVGVACALVSAGCSGQGGEQAAATSTPQTAPGAAWTAAAATGRVGGSTVVAGARRTKIDPTTVVCWGVGTPQHRGSTQVWHRFDCIAPTFRGAQAGPDLLFVLEPTGPRTFRILDARFSSYGGG